MVEVASRNGAADAPAGAAADVDRWLKDGEPVWEAIDFELSCSRCGYNLRLLTTPRCPECGLTFTWREVLAARHWRSSFLFEYQCRRTPVRSYLRTLWRGLRPWRFWSRDVSIHGPIHAGPLWFLLLTAPVGALVFVEIAAWTLAGVFRLWHTLQWPAGAVQSGWLHDWVLDGRNLYTVLAAALLRAHPAIGVALVGATVQLSATVLGLSLLRQTLGRCQVRRAQILRLVAYSAGPASLVWGMLVLLVVWAARLPPLRLPSHVMAVVALPVWFVLSLPPAVFIGAGWSRYLRLPRGVLVGPLISFAAMLATLIAMLVVLRIG